MSERRDRPPVMHRQPPRDYVDTGPRRAPALTREQKLLFGLLFAIALAGTALIFLGVK